MNSLLVGVLGVIDCYYVHKDVLLLAQLAGWTGRVTAANHWIAVVALGCVVGVWIARKRGLLAS